jgi:hypothetical protein
MIGRAPKLRSNSARAGAFAILSLATLPALAAQASPVTATAADTPVSGVRHVVGLENVKAQASGKLSVQSGALLFDAGKSQAKVAVTSIDDIFLGAETTQSGGTAGKVAKAAAIAAPYESGKVLSLLMRTKVDILTVLYRDENGGVHGAIFALPIGRAAGVRTQLIAAGAHASVPAEQVQKVANSREP